MPFLLWPLMKNLLEGRHPDYLGYTPSTGGPQLIRVCSCWKSYTPSLFPHLPVKGMHLFITSIRYLATLRGLDGPFSGTRFRGTSQECACRDRGSRGRWRWGRCENRHPQLISRVDWVTPAHTTLCWRLYSIFYMINLLCSTLSSTCSKPSWG